MITLEAFITKANIKQVAKNNSVKPIKYDDIKFRDPENSDMNKFSKRLQSNPNKTCYKTQLSPVIQTSFYIRI
jgi:hypothetical protein